jgi:hypothetical protein
VWQTEWIWLKLIRSDRAAGVSSIGIEISPKVRNPFQVAATETSEQRTIVRQMQGDWNPVLAEERKAKLQAPPRQDLSIRGAA